MGLSAGCRRLPSGAVAASARWTPSRTPWAARSVEPVVTTSSTSTASRPTDRSARKRAGRRSRGLRVACRGHHTAGRNAGTTGSPDCAPTIRARVIAGSTPWRMRRTYARGTGTRQAAPAGIRPAIWVASTSPAARRPPYLSRWTSRRAAPRWAYPVVTNTPPPQTNEGPDSSAARHPPHSVSPRRRRMGLAQAMQSMVATYTAAATPLPVTGRARFRGDRQRSSRRLHCRPR
jgi:hypothetical protein